MKYIKLIISLLIVFNFSSCTITEKLVLNENVINIDSKTLEVFFQPNIYLERVSNGIYLRKAMNGKYDPFLISKPILDKKIEIEL